ncbi:MAG: thioredoxin family protein [Candidatus Micrarchaeia archaeon]
MLNSTILSIRKFLQDKFNFYLVMGLLILGAAVFLSTQMNMAELPSSKLTVNYFYLPTCPHCAEQKPIILELQKEMEDIQFNFHDASTPEGSNLFYELASKAGMDLSTLGVPTTFIGDYPLVGFHSKDEIIEKITYCKDNCNEKPSKKDETQNLSTNIKEFDLPFLGKTDLTSYSLPMLAITLGLIDGFNPCAMWVLVYLIALVMNLNDRKKIWIIVGSFVLTSGILYFLFMTAWLNIFLLIGYIKLVTIIVGTVALGGGILSIKEYATTKEALVCKVGDEESHNKTAKKIEKIISEKISVGLIISIIALAFVVNSVEFVCSAAIPAIFTQVLALSHLSGLEYYEYIGLYVLFFMLDDLIIFGLAAFAVSSISIGEKYARYCKLFGGIILLILGIMLLFAPNLLA